VNGDCAIRVQFSRDDADGCFDPMFPGFGHSCVRKRDQQPDGAMTAHSQASYIVEEDDPGRAGCVGRLAQQRTYRDIRPARFLHNR
jgi:hypothetical protein